MSNDFPEELKAYEKEEREEIKKKIIRIRKGERVESLCNDPNPLVRGEIARLGMFPEIFVKDFSPYVRGCVTKSKNMLSTLVKDPNPSVRLEVAKTGYGFDQLKNDSCHIIKIFLLENGVNEIKHDKDENIREYMKNGHRYFREVKRDGIPQQSIHQEQIRKNQTRHRKIPGHI